MTRPGCVALAPGVRTAALPPIRYSTLFRTTFVYSSDGCGSLAYLSVTQRPGACCAKTDHVPSTSAKARSALVPRLGDLIVTLLLGHSPRIGSVERIENGGGNNRTRFTSGQAGN